MSAARHETFVRSGRALGTLEALGDSFADASTDGGVLKGSTHREDWISCV